MEKLEIKRASDWNFGYDAYSLEVSIDACDNDGKRQGWMDAQSDHDAHMQVEAVELAQSERPDWRA